MDFFSLPTILLLAASAASSTDVHFSIVRGQDALVGYPESVGKISVNWSHSVLFVSVVAHETGTSVINPNYASLVASGDKLTLCYKVEPVHYEPLQPIPTSLVPVVLRFEVAGLPEHAYQVAVSSSCAAAS